MSRVMTISYGAALRADVGGSVSHNPRADIGLGGRG
jgi:hypothetical protein